MSGPASSLPCSPSARPATPASASQTRDGSQPHLDPLDPGFVLNRWLHPSRYTAVPDPYRPGYAAQVQAKTEAQQAVLREARNALNGGREQHDAAGERTIDPSADGGFAALIAAHEHELEAEEHAHQAYMKYLGYLAELRGQALGQYLALEEAEPEDPEAGA